MPSTSEELSAMRGELLLVHKEVKAKLKSDSEAVAIFEHFSGFDTDLVGHLCEEGVVALLQCLANERDPLYAVDWERIARGIIQHACRDADIPAKDNDTLAFLHEALSPSDLSEGGGVQADRAEQQRDARKRLALCERPSIGFKGFLQWWEVERPEAATLLGRLAGRVQDLKPSGPGFFSRSPFDAVVRDADVKCLMSGIRAYHGIYFDVVTAIARQAALDAVLWEREIHEGVLRQCRDFVAKFEGVEPEDVPVFEADTTRSSASEHRSNVDNGASGKPVDGGHVGMWVRGRGVVVVEDGTSTSTPTDSRPRSAAGRRGSRGGGPRAVFVNGAAVRMRIVQALPHVLQTHEAHLLQNAFERVGRADHFIQPVTPSVSDELFRVSGGRMMFAGDTSQGVLSGRRQATDMFVDVVHELPILAQLLSITLTTNHLAVCREVYGDSMDFYNFMLWWYCRRQEMK